MKITELFDRFKAAMFTAVVNQYQPAGTLHEQFFPMQFSPALKTEVLQFDTHPNIAADVVSFDAALATKGRDLPGSFVVDIPKVGISRSKLESDILYNNKAYLFFNVRLQ